MSPRTPFDTTVSALSATVSLTCLSMSKHWTCFPIAVQNSGDSLPSIDSPRGWVHRFLWYYQIALTSCDSFCRTSFPSLGNTSCCAISTSGRSHAFSDLLWSPGLVRECTRKPQDLPSSHESSIVRSLLFQRPRSEQFFQTISEKLLLLPVL